jgi:hypothetical protein
MSLVGQQGGVVCGKVEVAVEERYVGTSKPYGAGIHRQVEYLIHPFACLSRSIEAGGQSNKYR